MLNIYRRHRSDCKHRLEGRKYRRCHCPIWVDGILSNHEIRKSTGLRDWAKAQALVRDWEAEGQPTPELKAEPITIKKACEEFLQDAVARNLREKTVYKYSLLFRQLQNFAQTCGFKFLKELDSAALRRFRATWVDGNLAALKKLERMKSFFRLAQTSKWTEANPAAELKSPKVASRPTLPFTHDEMMRILQGCDKYPGDGHKASPLEVCRLRALVFFLRYSGMRIGDAVSCAVDRVNGDKLLLYTQKTSVPVYCPLPNFVVKALEAVPHVSNRYFFWTGDSKLPTATGHWQAKLKKVFELGEVRDGHAHRFRDTFAVELLLAGVPLERVSVMLGHSSIKVTERHYAPWVLARQEQAEADVRRAWSQDPVALLETKGTLEVHEKPGVVN